MSQLPIPESSPLKVCFISFAYFAEQWVDMPPQILMDCICIFPNVKRSWIFEHHDLSNHKWTDFVRSRPDLLQALYIKEKQKNVIWKPESDDELLEHSKCESESCFDLDMIGSCSWDVASSPVNFAPVSSLWKSISTQLATLRVVAHGKTTDECFKPLSLDIDHWMKKSPHDFLFSTPEQVKEELMYGDGNFNAMKEIIYESNPDLLPMVIYNDKTYAQIHTTIESKHKSPQYQYTETTDEFGFTILH